MPSLTIEEDFLASTGMLPKNHFFDKFNAELAKAKAKEKADHEEQRSPNRDFKLFRNIRKSLRVSQRELGESLGVSVHTVRGWEQGKPIPIPVYLLMELMRDMPSVRKRLLTWW